jgi:hypothetical protein
MICKQGNGCLVYLSLLVTKQKHVIEIISAIIKSHSSAVQKLIPKWFIAFCIDKRIYIVSFFAVGAIMYLNICKEKEGFNKQAPMFFI